MPALEIEPTCAIIASCSRQQTRAIKGPTRLKKAKKELSRDIGLEVASIFGRYFLGLQDLHYGYWTDDLEVNINNLRIAQQKYTEFILSHIPPDVKTVLDVGCGTGHLAKSLLQRGCRVHCLSPSPFLLERTRQLLRNNTEIFQCRYEDLETDKHYDLILFAESLQYIDLRKAIENSARFLTDGGYMLICDVFKKATEAGGTQRGGSRLRSFENLIRESPFVLVEDIDITEQTAPTIDLMGHALKHAGKPAFDSVLRFLCSRYPFTSKLLLWKYNKQLKKINAKYFEGARTSEEFRKFKSYRLLLYRKTGR